MDILSREAIETLAQRRSGWHLSLFMPTYRAGAETQQNPIRCKNLRRQAAEQLLTGGLRPADVQTMLAPIDDLLGNVAFWQHQSDGLAVFLAPEVFRPFRLPLSLAELVVVSHRFHLKPLLPLLSGDGRFYVLALSQNDVRLVQCTRHSVTEVELEDVPTSLAEALPHDDPQRQLQYHTGTQGTEMPGGPGGGAGQRAAMYHGHGTGTDDTKDRLTEYFRVLDGGLNDVLQDEQAPLVLAGVDYLLPMYRQVTSYPHVVAAGVTGNPEGLRPEELQQQAWPLVEPLFRQAQQSAAEQYARLAGTGRTANDLQAVVAAAYVGRIETLFVAVDAHQWGSFDPASQQVRLAADNQPEDEDLFDFAAVHTLLQSGTVYAVAADTVPGGAQVAAVLRY